MTGAYTATGLKGIEPPAYSTTLTGNASGALPTQKISVNHPLRATSPSSAAAARATAPATRPP